MALFHLDRNIRKFCGHGIDGREIRLMEAGTYGTVATVWSRRGPGEHRSTWTKIGTRDEVLAMMGRDSRGVILNTRDSNGGF